MGHSRPLFLYFRLFYKQLTVNKCSIKVANDWIQTWVLWYWRRPLCQLRHTTAQEITLLKITSNSICQCSRLLCVCSVVGSQIVLQHWSQSSQHLLQYFYPQTWNILKLSHFFASSTVKQSLPTFWNRETFFLSENVYSERWTWMVHCLLYILLSPFYLYPDFLPFLTPPTYFSVKYFSTILSTTFCSETYWVPPLTLCGILPFRFQFYYSVISVLCGQRYSQKWQAKTVAQLVAKAQTTITYILFNKMGQLLPLFVYFRSFQTNFYR